MGVKKPPRFRIRRARGEHPQPAVAERAINNARDESEGRRTYLVAICASFFSWHISRPLERDTAGYFIVLEGGRPAETLSFSMSLFRRHHQTIGIYDLAFDSCPQRRFLHPFKERARLLGGPGRLAGGVG